VPNYLADGWCTHFKWGTVDDDDDDKGNGDHVMYCANLREKHGNVSHKGETRLFR